jgi:hypothetical protein
VAHRLPPKMSAEMLSPQSSVIQPAAAR